IAGHLEGRVFTVTSEHVSIGRESTNEISISEDLSVSGHHCGIQKEAEGFRLVDMGSDAGTFVNGLPVKTHLLQTGDMIRIGETVFRFEDFETEFVSAPTSVMFDGTIDVSKSMVVRQPEVSLELLPQGTQFRRDLKTLIEISTVIHSMRALY